MRAKQPFKANTLLVSVGIGLCVLAPSRMSRGRVFRTRGEHVSYQRNVAKKIERANQTITALKPSSAFMREYRRFGVRATELAARSRPHQEARENSAMISLGHFSKDRGPKVAVLRVLKGRPDPTGWDTAISQVLDSGKRWNVQAIKKMPNGNVLEVHRSVDIDQQKFFGGHYTVRDANGKTVVSRGSLAKLKASIGNGYGVGKKAENRIKKISGISASDFAGLLERVHPVFPQVSQRMSTGSPSGVLQRPLPSYFQVSGRQ